MPTRMKVAYFVHDINDPAVRRRVRMLEDGGAKTTLLGFSRRKGVAPDGMEPIVLGHTADAQLLQRAAAVVKAALMMPRWWGALRGAELIVARQLEVAVLAALARRLTGNKAPLVYECLDIHRVMLSKGAVGRVMRGLEALVLRESASLMVSSRGFVDWYFRPAHGALPAIELVENKVLQSELPDRALQGTARAQDPIAVAPAPPWRIGWYGILRCRRSLDLLASLARALPGSVEISIRGRVAETALPDFEEIVASTPGLSFGGAYDRITDLAGMYAAVHFFWAIDFFDGESSAWLLQNRLYEGGLFGCIPLARRNIETGRWLAAYNAGVLLDDPLEAELMRFFSTLAWPEFRAAQEAMDRVPMAAFLHDGQYCEALVKRLARKPARNTVETGQLEEQVLSSQASD
jgi:hypothetical protein